MIHQHNLLAHTQPFETLRKPFGIRVKCYADSYRIPIVGTRMEFDDTPSAEPSRISHDDAFALLQDILEEVDISIWGVLDRLDEAFQGFPNIEIPALRALLRTYLDLRAFPRVILKLFVRRDFFRRIIADGFVNLTHVNARRVEIGWSPDDLYDLLYKRVTGNADFVQAMGLTDQGRDLVFKSIFPEKVDPGTRKPSTWMWILRRIRDGNDVLAPRNLIDLVTRAQAVQLRREEREPRELTAGEPLIEPDSMKSGLAALSATRVEDTLLAEAGPAASLIERFRGGKAEHSNASLEPLFKPEGVSLQDGVQALTEIGFLERVGKNYKIPALYRDGLGITQGKAF